MAAGYEYEINGQSAVIISLTPKKSVTIEDVQFHFQICLR